MKFCLYVHLCSLRHAFGLASKIFQRLHYTTKKPTIFFGRKSIECEGMKRNTNICLIIHVYVYTIEMESVIDCEISARLNPKVIFSFSKLFTISTQKFVILSFYLILYWLNAFLPNK